MGAVSGSTPEGGADNDAGAANFGGTGVGGGNGSGGSSGQNGTGGSAGGAGAPDPALCLTKSFEAHAYVLCREGRTWSDARDGCSALGMQLARVDSDAENRWLAANANTDGGRSSQIWIGGSDAAVEGEWHWLDGELFWVGGSTGSPQNDLYTGWNSREPNNVGGDEACLYLETTGANPEWYDGRCATVWPFICEAL
jgi:hypothetical protein